MKPNKSYVDDGFDRIQKPLADYIREKLTKYCSDHDNSCSWREKLVDVPKGAPYCADDFIFTRSLDMLCLLKTIYKQWGDAFADDTDFIVRAYSMELLNSRNKVSHLGQDDYDSDDALRDLDTMWRLSMYLGFECVGEIKAKYNKLKEAEYTMYSKPSVNVVSDGGDDIAAPVPTKPALAAQDMYRRFWESFEKILGERGNPFIVTPRTRKSGNGETIYDGSALVCSDKQGGDVCLSVEFRPSPRMGLIRVSIIVGKASHKCFENLKGHRKEIDNMLKRNHRWDDKGMRGAGRSRIKTEIKIDPYDTDGYDGYVVETIPIIKRYIGVCRKYLPKAIPLTK